HGGIGADFVAKSAPDGYTLLVTANGPIVVNPVLYARVPYDPVRDFAPVAQCTVYQYVLVTLAGSHIKSIADLVDAARARPGAVSYGSTGVGDALDVRTGQDRKSTRLNSSHVAISYAVFCLKKKKNKAK